MRRHLIVLFVVSFVALLASSEKEEIVWSGQENPIQEQIHNIRKLPDDVRAGTTKTLALQIRQLPAAPNKLRLAMGLAGRATEGDFGHDTLQEVATTLEAAIKEESPKEQDPYLELASLARYEHVNTALDSPEYSAAIARLESEDRERGRADFKLKDLKGRSWSLKNAHGKVVLLNFWATWCPPCRKEMPDLQALSQRFESQGLVILGVSDDDPKKVRAFIQQQAITYPVLLDPGSKANKSFHVEGIPKTFVYDREGKIVAQSIDMRTQKQFLDMLAAAGVK
jgi:peroxiredoxin